MRVFIKNDYNELSAFVADYIAEKINEFKPTAENPFILGLPTGSSPIGTYNHLAELHKKGKVSFEHVITFNMDEYVGLAHDDPESYRHFMHKHLFDRIDIKKENINILDGMASDLKKECDAFEAKIKKYGRIHLFLAGIGSNGHLAFNEPGSSMSSRTRVKKLTYTTREDNSRFFGDDISKVPGQALTVGVGTVYDSEEVMLIASGRNKADAIHRTIEGGISHMCTASMLQMHQRGVIVCDRNAASKLSPHVAEYFQQIVHW